VPSNSSYRFPKLIRAVSFRLPFVYLLSHISNPVFLYASNRYGDQIVAIKVLNRGSTHEEKATLEARFIREVNMMCKVKHENLVKVLPGLNVMFVWLHKLSILLGPPHNTLCTPAVHWSLQGTIDGDC